ncbi:S-layer homology domain-containing protein [Oceanobacillus limi]|uniref:S-layer homology domain-containing protein n=1 Tax=Oceanobacillus limi TaxID=930131 RepID=A0A1I0A2P1_9BACI|nr:S8 family serine peptidase [Oceanobacillus limi]SES88416.1 S-layer homology domain-containing protein [Oceanobacillus limi]
MRRVIVLFLFLFISISPSISAEDSEGKLENRQVVVQYNEPLAADMMPYDLEVVETSQLLKRNNIYVYEVPDQLNYSEVINNLEQNKNIRSVEPNEVRSVDNSNLSGEPYYSQQWYLDTINQQKAIGLTNDDTSITVAVIDTGIQADHPDLNGKILPGYDFYNNDSDPEDDNGHGTFISGIIAANINETGMAGMTKQAKVLPIKVGNYSGEMLSSNIIEGIYYAIDQGVDVINMSYGGLSRNFLEEAALEEAYNQGIVLVAASGNDGNTQLMYPASYPNVISVGAMQQISTNYNPNLARADFSNYGTTLDVGAPGTEILSTLMGGYAKGQGTSFAAPMVSGLAVMLKAKHPQWTPAMIEWAIEKGAINGRYSTGAWEPQLGYGVIDVFESITLDSPDMKNDVSNSKQDSYSINLNSEESEYLQIPRDQDWFEFEVPNDMEINVSVRSDDNVLNIVGELYRKGEGSPFEILQGLNQTGEIPLELSKGTYQINVYDRNTRWSESPYQLILTGDTSLVHFIDVSNKSSHYDGIQALVKRGAINGYPMTDGSRQFRPENDLSREHAAKIFAKVLELPNPANLTEVMKNFNDVSETYTYANEIGATYEAGIFLGDQGNFKFGPMTREQMATIIVRAFELTDTGEETDVNLNAVSPSHRSNVKILKQYGITTETNFRAYERVTRAQFASFVYRAMNVTPASY